MRKQILLPINTKLLFSNLLIFPPMNILLQAGSQTQMIYQVVLWVGIFGVFYFLMIRPQQKKQKDQKNFISSLKKGDAVITIGGLHGKVIAVNEHTVSLEVDGKGTRMVFDKSAISKANTGNGES
jgi:preprotein translocase subunit YajC